MIGPPGYGDARFISLKTPLNYKIRFENDPNATAPAQHVIILHTLDQDLDIRTFRITGFGFGNLSKKLSNPRASLQVRSFDAIQTPGGQVIVENFERPPERCQHPVLFLFLFLEMFSTVLGLEVPILKKHIFPVIFFSLIP